jgi:AraC family transcriptional activator of pobA
MPYDPSPVDEISVTPLQQLSALGSWQVSLAHHRDSHLLIWITRGQGLALLDGSRRGFSAHNALFVPAGSLFSLEAGRNCYGQVLEVPVNNPLALPRKAHHLRTSSAADQTAMTGLFEALQREQEGRPALWHRAMQAYGELAGIWLRRQIHEAEMNAGRRSAARRLSAAYCARVVEYYKTGMSMAEHAAALDVTPTHLTRVCKAETSKTAATLLTERQYHEARRMLVESDMPMRDIADTLGFGSAAYFTRFISQHSGKTPSKLRKAAKV